MATTSSSYPFTGTENYPPVLTKREAADFLGCTTRYLERQVSTGRLRACKPTGKLWRVYLCDLDAFLQSGATTKNGGE